MNVLEKAQGAGAALRSGDIASALRTLRVEAEGLQAVGRALGGELGERLSDAIALIVGRQGRVIVTGMGKSGHVGRKIAATFASTGTATMFLHPAEASHGDLGMIRPEDLVLALSWSGETAELSDVVAYTRRFSVPLVAITSRAGSSLGAAADIALVLPSVVEACPNGLAPTSSTTAQLALGDALAICLLERRGFSPEDFRGYHPGGKLGSRLKRVRDLMHGVEAVPAVGIGSSLSGAICAMTSGRFGLAGVTDEAGRLVGVMTDGDLRRCVRGGVLRPAGGRGYGPEPAHDPAGRAGAGGAGAYGDRADYQFVCDRGWDAGWGGSHT